MSRLRFVFSKTLLAYLWQEFLVRYRFKYVLPKVTETTLDGIRLDLSTLSLKVRNRILMGIYEAHEKQLCQELLSPADAVLEIGGAIGFIGLVCQKKIGIKRYFTFEANPDTLAVLRRNYELNGLSPAAWNIALGPGDGPLELEVSSDFWENSILPPQKRDAATRTVQVPGARLGSLLAKVGVPVNVLIIDVEGAEQFIDLDEIPVEVDKIIIELHPAVLGPRKTYDLIARFIQKGFYVACEQAGTFAFQRELVPSPPAAGRWEFQEREVALALDASPGH